MQTPGWIDTRCGCRWQDGYRLLPLVDVVCACCAQYIPTYNIHFGATLSLCPAAADQQVRVEDRDPPIGAAMLPIIDYNGVGALRQIPRDGQHWMGLGATEWWWESKLSSNVTCQKINMEFPQYRMCVILSWFSKTLRHSNFNVICIRGGVYIVRSSNDYFFLYRMPGALLMG